MNLMPLADLLQAAGLGTKGVDLFLNMMPAGAEDAVLLRTPLTGVPINYELPGFYQTEYQLIVRCLDYDAGRTRIEQIIQALTIAYASVGPWRVNYSRPKHEPVSFPLSDGNLIEFSTNFDFCFVKV